MENEENTGTPPETTQQPDLLKNMKAEMDRKLSNMEAQNAQLQALIQSLNQPKQAESPKKISVFDDEDAFANKIKNETAAEIRAELARQNAESAKRQAALQAVVNEYPELSDTSSELSKRAVEIFNSFSPEEQASPLAFKAAATEAAAENGLKPKRKRSTDDSFTLGGNGTQPKAQKKEALSPVLEDLANKFGLKLTPETKERLSKNHGRDTYNKWR